MLYFGSFNPVHNGHIAMAEYVVERGLCDELIMIVSPQNPLKRSAELAPELERFTMAEMACAASRFPEQIKASVIEFMLEKPSYTINTLRHLSSEYGHLMSFSILMGGDLVEQLEKWKDYEEILNSYHIYIYPRRGERVEKYLDRVTLMEDAPFFEVSSTEVRHKLMCGEEVSTMLCSEVLKHIKESGFWSEEQYLDWLTTAIESAPEQVGNYIERGRYHYRHQSWGEALNDFNRALRLDPENQEAGQLKIMASEILEFRYTDIYNP